MGVIWRIFLVKPTSETFDRESERGEDMNNLTFMVIGGYLGAGKTTTMIAATKELESRGVKAGIIANNLGIKDLVDADYSQTQGADVTPITGGCICYQTQTLVDTLRRLRDVEGKQVVISDIPGCGIGGLDHVYNTLDREYTGEFQLAPFIAVADPERLRVIMPEQADINLPQEMAYLFDAQLKEADAIVLNKIDLLDDAQRAEYIDFLGSRYPGIPVLAISARTGEGISDFVDFFLSQTSAVEVRDIGYDGPEHVAAEKKMSWYNRRFFVKGSEPFDGNAFVTAFIEAVRGLLIAAKRNAPHLKVFAIASGDEFVKASLIGVDYPIESDHEAVTPTISMRVIVNVRAACESKLLGRIMDQAVQESCDASGLDYNIFFTECFGMLDEGLE